MVSEGPTLHGYPVEVGDHVWHITKGWAKVDEIVSINPVQIRVVQNGICIGHYTSNGKNAFPSYTIDTPELFWQPVKITPPPKPDVENDTCPRNRNDCYPLGLAISEEDNSFTCCGRNRESSGDIYRLCFHNSHIDHMDDCDQNDLLSQLYVISRALLVVEQEIDRVRAE